MRKFDGLKKSHFYYYLKRQKSDADNKHVHDNRH